MKTVPLPQLQAFLAVARHRSFSGAAREVGVSRSRLNASLAEQGLGLAYAFEPMVSEQLRAGRLQRVLERYAPTVAGFFLYFPSVARRSLPLRLFIEAAKELSVRVVS